MIRCVTLQVYYLFEIPADLGGEWSASHFSLKEASLSEKNKTISKRVEFQTELGQIISSTKECFIVAQSKQRDTVLVTFPLTTHKWPCRGNPKVNAIKLIATTVTGSRLSSAE